jgi:hypothetical protein
MWNNTRYLCSFFRSRYCRLRCNLEPVCLKTSSVSCIFRYGFSVSISVADFCFAEVYADDVCARIKISYFWRRSNQSTRVNLLSDCLKRSTNQRVLALFS